MKILGLIWTAADPHLVALGLNLFLRLGLSATFLASGTGKLVDLPGARQALGDFGVPSRWVRTCASALCYLELALAIGLLLDQTSRLACLGTLILMLAMSIGIGRLLKDNRTPPCHCFGAIHSAPVGLATLARAIGLAILAGLAAKLPLFSLTPSPFTCLGALALFSLGGYATRGYAVKQVKKTAAQATLQVGQRLPAVRLKDGRWLESCLPAAERSLFIFTSTGCSACDSIKEPLQHWVLALQERLPIIELRATTEEDPDVEHQLTRDDLAKFRVATPGAMLVDRSGVILAPPVANLEQIEALIRITLHQME